MPKNPAIIDGHNDTLLRIYRNGKEAEDVFFRGGEFYGWEDDKKAGHLDLPRAQAGGLGGGFFAVFVPNDTPNSYSGRKTYPPAWLVDGKMRFTAELPQPLDRFYAVDFVMGMVDLLYRLEARAEGALRVVRTADEMADCLADGTLGVILHFEGVEAIDEELHALRVFHAAGLRSLGIVWSRPNAFGHGVPFGHQLSPDTGPGLTDAGRRLVRACNELGILIDNSHLNEAGFWDVAALSDAPLVASHSGAHALSPAARNLTDRQLDAIAESGGLVGVNYHVGFLRADGRFDVETSLEEIVTHAAYMAERMGVAHVALGSDFDGATMPDDLKDVAGQPKLLEAFRRRGFSEGEIEQIAHGNWLRVLRETWGE